MIESVWQSQTCTTMANLEAKLKGLSGALHAWGRDTFGHVHKELHALRSKVEHMRMLKGRVGPTYEETKIVERIVELQFREETMW
jgi:hypothetical protein